MKPNLELINLTAIGRLTNVLLLKRRIKVIILLFSKNVLKKINVKMVKNGMLFSFKDEGVNIKSEIIGDMWILQIFLDF